MKLLMILRWTGLVLSLPAALMCVCGVIQSAFGLRTANELFDWLQTLAWTGPLFSPWILLGGPVLLVAMHAPAVVRLSADAVNEYWIVALSVKRLGRHIVPVLVGCALLALLLGYAFVENFRIVPR